MHRAGSRRHPRPRSTTSASAGSSSTPTALVLHGSAPQGVMSDEPRRTCRRKRDRPIRAATPWALTIQRASSILVIVGQIVFLASSLSRYRVDLTTSDGIYTLTDSTRNDPRRGLEDRLVIEAYFSPKDELPAQYLARVPFAPSTTSSTSWCRWATASVRRAALRSRSKTSDVKDEVPSGSASGRSSWRRASAVEGAQLSVKQRVAGPAPPVRGQEAEGASAR